MANITELADRIRILHSNKNAEEKVIKEKIEICFELLESYCAIRGRKLNTEMKSCCYAALILSGVVQKGLGGRTRDFVAKNGSKLHIQAQKLLPANILRMESY